MYYYFIYRRKYINENLLYIKEYPLLINMSKYKNVFNFFYNYNYLLNIYKNDVFHFLLYNINNYRMINDKYIYDNW